MGDKEAIETVGGTDEEQASDEWEDQRTPVTPTGNSAPDPKGVTHVLRSVPSMAELKEADTHTYGQRAGRGSVVGINHCYRRQDRAHHGTAEPRTQSHSICVFKARPTYPSGNIGQAQAHKIRGGSCAFCDTFILIPLRGKQIDKVIAVGQPQRSPRYRVW